MRVEKKVILLAAALSLAMAGCSESKPAVTNEVGTSGGEVGEIKIAFLADRLGDNAMNDETYRGVQQFEQETGITVTVVEAPELQDHEMNARTFAQEGYNLILDATSKTSELYAAMAPEFPDTHFVVTEGTIEGLDNVTNLRDRPSEAAFLVGAFSVLMNQELGGRAEAAFVGGIRNPDLERSQYGFTAGAEYVGGTATSVYVGNFTDVAKGKEIALQLYNKGLKVVQAFAGGAGMGVYQAAESMGSGYFALGAAAGQFNLSDYILASQVKYTGTSMYDACVLFHKGELKGGTISKGIKEDAVGIKYNPLHEAEIPKEIKDKIQEIEDKIVSGELVPPMTEDEYKAFQK